MRKLLGRPDRHSILVATVALGMFAAMSLSLTSAAPMASASGVLGQALGQTVLCDPVTGLPLSSSPDQLAVAGRGGDGVREPDLGQVRDDLPASAKGRSDADFTATIPAYFHVITDGEIGGMTNAQIRAQIRVLNQTFAGLEGGADTGFTFELAGITRTNNSAWFYAGIGGNEHKMKKALRQGGNNALNIYSTTAGPYLGWAYLPEILTKPGQEFLDGVVIDWESWLGADSDTYDGRFDQGETGTHEVGHWLNLEHTFYGGCTVAGDFVADTPAQKVPTSGCPIGKDTCPKDPGLDPIHNYMDYSFDSCYTEFTPGQAQRMQDSYLHFRA